MQFNMPSVGKWIAIGLSLIVGIAAFLLRARIALPETDAASDQSLKKKRNLLMMAGFLRFGSSPASFWAALVLASGSLRLPSAQQEWISSASP